MTVHDLVEKLLQFPEDATVMLEVDQFIDECMEVYTDVGEVFICGYPMEDIEF